MNVKKYPQSHLLITGNTTKIMIDPGNITFNKGFEVQEFQGMDGYLITHQHADHMDPNNIKSIVNSGMVYGNKDVVLKLKSIGVEATTIYDKKPFKIGEFEITPYDLPHCKLIDGSDGPPNTGFLINRVFFHPGDGIELEGLKVDNLALPIAGPSIAFYHALSFAKSLQAKVVIPMHFDSFNADPALFAKRVGGMGIEVRVLQTAEETEL